MMFSGFVLRWKFGIKPDISIKYWSKEFTKAVTYHGRPFLKRDAWVKAVFFPSFHSDISLPWYVMALITKVVSYFHIMYSIKKNQKHSISWFLTKKMTLQTRIVLYLTFGSKSIQIPRTFYGCFHRPLALFTYH